MFVNDDNVGGRLFIKKSVDKGKRYRAGANNQVVCVKHFVSTVVVD
jgi:hypothetical protein